MWKEEPLLPRSATRHVAVENLNFVLNLRKEDQGDKPIRPKSPAAIPSIHSKILQHKEEEEKKLRVELKETGCKNSKCLLVEVELLESLGEKNQLIDLIADKNLSLLSDEQFYQEMAKEYEDTVAVQHEMMRKLTLLDIDLSKKSYDLQKFKEEQLNLEEQISSKHAELRGLTEAKNNSPKTMKSLVKDSSRKHNGIYTAALTGQAQWSCCLATSEFTCGCIEENSIGIRSELGRIKNSFHNYVKMPPIGMNSYSVWKEASNADVKRSSNHNNRSFSRISFQPSNYQRVSEKRRPNNLHLSNTHLPSHDSLHMNTWISQQDKSLPRTSPLCSMRASFADFEEFPLQFLQHHENLRNNQHSMMIISRESIGKVRPSSSSRLSGNRPMSSPSGFHLYQQT